MAQPEESAQNLSNSGKEAPAASAKSAKKKSSIRRKKVSSRSKQAKTNGKVGKQSGRNIQVSADQLPRRSLEQALRAARALRDTLAGGPATWEDIASAMDIKPSAQNKYFLWSAQAYNLVQKDDNQYTLSEIGRKILAPTSPNEAQEATVQAVMTPVILSRFFTDYNGSPFPAEEHLGNILERKYGVPRERLAEARLLIRENGLFARILEQKPDGTMTVRLDPRSTGIPKPAALSDSDQNQEPPVVSQPAETAAAEFDRVCFVITPIGEDESEQRRHANMVLKSIIEPVVAELDLTARRADQIDRSGLITQQIFQYLSKSRICIADLSFNNANAFYELGIRHMCKLPTVQIIRKGDKIPFDVSQGRTIKIDMSDVYSVMDSVESAKKELRQHLRHSLSGEYKGDDNPINTYLPGIEVKIPK